MLYQRGDDSDWRNDFGPHIVLPHTTNKYPAQRRCELLVKRSILSAARASSTGWSPSDPDAQTMHTNPRATALPPALKHPPYATCAAWDCAAAWLCLFSPRAVHGAGTGCCHEWVCFT